MRVGLKVRKQFILNRGKIETVRRLVDAKTDTEAINKALDLVIANMEIKKAISSLKGKGRIKDIYARASG